MTREDIDNIISIICPNDEDFEKPIISPAYLKKELEVLALEQEPKTGHWVEIDEEPHEVWVRCPYCGKGHELMGCNSDRKDGYLIIECECGNYFKDRL